MRNQTLIWTALPNGRAPNSDGFPVDPNHLALSVFLTPRLSTDEGGNGPTLTPYFPDFVNWPETIANISFTVTFAGGPAIPATISNFYYRERYPLDPTRWPLVFNPTTTGVKPLPTTPPAYVGTTPNSYDSFGALASIENVYQSFGVNAPVVPPVLTGDSVGIPVLNPGSGLNGPLAQVKQIAGAADGTSYIRSKIATVVEYWNRPAPAQPDNVPWEPTLEILDFHAAVSALADYPALLRAFGLVFDLVIPNPTNFTSGTSTVFVTPKFTSAFTGANGWTTVNVTPKTACQLLTAPAGPGAPVFLPLQRLTVEDYQNGMLDLADTNRFAVTDLDIDAGSMSLNVYSNALQSVAQYLENLGSLGSGQTTAVTLPSLRSNGPTILRTGWATQLQNLANRQANFQTTLNNYLAGTSKALPTFYAEDLIRGHRFDVYTESDSEPGWRSLSYREGSYNFGTYQGNPAAPGPANLPLSATDEGIVVPGASQPANVSNPPPNLYVSEEISRWKGWSQSCPLPGGHITTGDVAEAEQFNPPAPTTTDQYGNYTPQMSASFTPVPGTLPKLRFGNEYQFRARGVDLAGNSVSPSSQDNTTATAPGGAAIPGGFTHFRYEPVAPPVVVPTAPLTPGQGVMLVALLDYSNGTVPTPVGRWFFPPRVSELMAEEHGMFDGFSLGSPPNPALGPDGTVPTYDFISDFDAGTLVSTQNMSTDPVTGTPYYPTDPTNPLGSPPVLSWIPDPLSLGVAFSGLPASTPGLPSIVEWGTQPWPTMAPVLVQLEAGTAPGIGIQEAISGEEPITAVIATLPPAAVYDVHVSSALTSPVTLGVWNWLLNGLSGLEVALYYENATNGQIWLLSPYHTVRMVYAVRLPLLGPTFIAPQVTPRPYGSTQAQIYDLQFSVDEPSTASIDFSATWTDPVDDPTDPDNDPDRDFVTTTADAFKLSVPDPNPPAAIDEPGTVEPAPETFALYSKPGATQDFGDTKYHSVTYTATGTSRFSEFFRSYPPTTITASTSATPIDTEGLGVDPGSVKVVDPNGNDVQPIDYTVNPAATNWTVDPVGGTITFTDSCAALGESVTVSWIPTVTLAGEPVTFPILSSARPKPPKILRVVPAWEIEGPVGSISPGVVGYHRQGGFLRVYLDRPWWTTGYNELLGVVTIPRSFQSAAPPPDPQIRLGTLMALDPINLADPNLHFVSTPQNILGTTTIPSPIPGRGKWTNPARVALAEDPNNLYNIYPFEVNFDYESDQWYADIQFQFFSPDLPPPGYFVRLALVRFQPYSWPGAEVSPVALATFAQPVSNRTVLVKQEGHQQAVRVLVKGPGYEGFRPPTAPAALPPPDDTVYDYLNDYAPDPYSNPPPGTMTTSTMVVDVQAQTGTSIGLPGNLGWESQDFFNPPVELTPSFNNGIITWEGVVPLPYAIGDGIYPQRVRISEVDYYTGGAISTVDTTLRRPFICHIEV